MNVSDPKDPPSPTSREKPESAPGRRWKLPVTFLALVLIGAGSVIGLVITLNCQESSITVLSIRMSRIWLAASLGGVLGGSARGLYSFLFENWAFHYRQTTGESSPCMRYVWETQELEDDMDPLVCWYLYLIKPAAGATLGFLFAVGVELGLITLGGVESSADTKAVLRAIGAGGFAGLFMENAMHWLRRNTIKEGRNSRTRETERPDLKRDVSGTK